MQVVVWVNDKDLITDEGMSVNDDGVTPTPLFQQTYKQGDVIDVVPDGTELGDQVMSNLNWAVLSVPDLLPTTATVLCQSGTPDEPDLDTIYPARAYNLDVTSTGLGIVDDPAPSHGGSQNKGRKSQVNPAPYSFVADDITGNLTQKTPS